MILRLNDDGSAPADNPFHSLGGELQKVFAYGIRNSFGMAFDPYSGSLWEQENGDDSFDEINRVEAGMNGGWIQVIGPVSRVSSIQEHRDHHVRHSTCSSFAIRPPTSRIHPSRPSHASSC